MNVAQRLADYTELYNTMEIKPSVLPEVKRISDKIKANKDKYQEISDALGGKIPYYFIGIIHNMESGMNFNRHLHEGSPLTKRTIYEPKGRPIQDPKNIGGYTFLESATDALTMKGYDKKESWTLPEILYRLEKFNGFGYHYKGIQSPYIFAGTNHYTKGKFVSDGVFDPEAVSKQIGAAAIIKLIL